MSRVSPRTRAYVRRRAEEHMIATVEVVRLAPSSLDETTGMISSRQDDNYSGYSGKARIWSVTNASTITVGEEEVSTAVTYVSIPWDSAPVPDVDDYIVVTAYADDPDLVGRYYRILNVDGGGLLRATRRCQVAAVTENRDSRSRP